jgi:GntR family transcriptional regulator/MocR family aminotransferase
MDVHISLDGRGGLAGQIYQQVRAAILDGRLLAGNSLPSTRELARRLDVSRNTVSAAYDRLMAEGYLAARAGVRTYVSDHVLEREHDPIGTSGPASRPRRVWDRQPAPIDLSDGPLFDFRSGVPDARLFPFATWRSLVGRELRETTVGSGAYAEPSGHSGLRSAIARHVGVSRGVRATAAQVLVTSGSQQAVDLVCRVIVEPGDVVAVEDPGWLPPRVLFETAGANLAAVPVDAEGLVVDAIPDRARLVYVTPSHQFPLGVAMSMRRRLSLLSWAQRADATIIEDDYDSEFRYDGRPVEPLHSLDRCGRVVYVNSFSKTMLPTLRLGFCIAPPTLIPALQKAKYCLDWHTTLPMQAALARFIDTGLFARHIRRMRRVYQARRDRIVAMLAHDFVEELEPIVPVAGLHLATRMPDPGRDDEAVAARARQVGVGLGSLSFFAVTRPQTRGLVLGYGLIPIDRIEPGLRRLRRCLQGEGG